MGHCYVVVSPEVNEISRRLVVILIDFIFLCFEHFQTGYSLSSPSFCIYNISVDDNALYTFRNH